ncbi:MAG: thioredoxin TrxC [Gammaproteobacteria bacterium]|nr:thioredoxin TrxC [Gammaproteobacteria bacterium]
MSLVVCPHCHGINRVPHDKCRADSGAICGHCKQALFDGSVIETDLLSFNKHIQRSELPIVIDFWAPWCGPCRQFAPTFSQVAQAFAGKAQFIKVNTEQQQQLAAQYGIRSIPTLMLFKGGQKVAELAGALPAPQFTQWVRQHL